MGWYLVLVLYNTSDVLVKKFDNKITCEKYLASHQREYKRDKNIKSSSCEEGAPIEFEMKKSHSNDEQYI